MRPVDRTSLFLKGDNREMKLRAEKLMIAGSALALALTLTAPVALTANAMQDAKGVYNQKCAVCHGIDGAGNTPYGRKNSIRDLRSKEVREQSDEKLLQIISSGGGGGRMPSYEKALGAETCNQLVGYLRQLGGK